MVTARLRTHLSDVLTFRVEYIHIRLLKHIPTDFLCLTQIDNVNMLAPMSAHWPPGSNSLDSSASLRWSKNSVKNQ